MNKQEYHNILNSLRVKSFSHIGSKKLLNLFEIEATNNEDFYYKFCNWLGDNNKFSTVYLRDELSLQFENDFKDSKEPCLFFNAWCKLDTYLLQIKDGR